ASLRPEMICPNNCILAQSAVVVQPRMKRALHASPKKSRGGAIMERKRIVLIIAFVLGIFALVFISMPMRAQNQAYPFPGYPPEFAPSRTSRPRPTPPPLPTGIKAGEQ